MTLPATEAFDPRMDYLDTWPAETVLAALLEGQMAAIAAVQPALPMIARAAEAAADRLRAGGRLAYVGAGTSGRIGVQDGSELPPTFDWPADRLILLMAGGRDAVFQAVENAEDQTDTAAADIDAHAIGPADVVIGLAASGSTPYTVAAIRRARSRGAITIGVVNSPGGTLLTAAEYPVLVETGTEPIAGSTRMKAGTAQKVVLNLFSTLLMVRLHRVYRGRMVDMQARNEKLRRRGERMLRDLTECDEPVARDALAQAGGKVKLAVLLVAGLDLATAKALLQETEGDLRAALGSGRADSD